MAEGGLRVVVLGYLVRGPLGGLAWHYLNYLVGLTERGHDVWFLEDSDDYPSCYDPRRDVVDTDPSYGLRFTGAALDRLGLGSRWAYHDRHTGRWLGPAADHAPRLCVGADLLLNISGVNPLRDWHLDAPRRILVDTDPVFTQIRHLTDPAAAAAARRHTDYATFAAGIGAADCAVPDDGLPWRPTRQPVALGAWPPFPPEPGGPVSTVMQWRSYRAPRYHDVRYGMKADAFAAVEHLPRRLPDVWFELALGGGGRHRDRLAAAGWQVVDARHPTADPWTYQRYIRRSAAELSVAKQGYVTARSGWFSERSACYLAAGRPVVLQDTGFSRLLPTGEGLLAFTTPDEAAAAVEAVRRDHPRHSEAARALAEEHFDAAVVLDELLAAAAVR